MPTVWKYPLPVEEGTFELEMPKRAVVLNVRMKDGRPHLWAMVDQDLMLEPREFFLVYTGVQFDWGWSWIGTAVSDGTNLVFHYFERRKK